MIPSVPCFNNNAFAAVTDGGHIDIAARQEGKGAVAIKFSDDGCGIPKEELGRVFEPFFSTKTGQGGTGLGLSITYNLTQEIGGQISVESEVGMGTSFIITLPLGIERKENNTNASLTGGR
jgi:two-component system NtrC family sensor kinase